MSYRRTCRCEEVLAGLGSAGGLSGLSCRIGEPAAVRRCSLAWDQLVVSQVSHVVSENLPL